MYVYESFMYIITSSKKKFKEVIIYPYSFDIHTSHTPRTEVSIQAGSRIHLRSTKS